MSVQLVLIFALKFVLTLMDRIHVTVELAMSLMMEYNVMVSPQNH